MDQINIIIYFIFFCFLIIGSLLIYYQLLVNKEKNKWNVKSYNSMIEGFGTNEGLTGNKAYPNNTLHTWDKPKYNEILTCNYDFTATILLVGRGADGASSGRGEQGGGGGAYYYDTSFQFNKGSTYTLSIDGNGTSLTDGTSIVTCDSGSGIDGGKCSVIGSLFSYSNSYDGNSGGYGSNGDFREAPKPNDAIPISDSNFIVGGGGGGSGKYWGSYSGEFTNPGDYGGCDGKPGCSSHTGKADTLFGKPINAYTYGNGGGCSCIRNYGGGGQGGGGAIIIYYTATAPTTLAPTTTPAPTIPKLTTPAPTFTARTLMPVSDMTPIEKLDKNEFYIIPLPEKYSKKINSNTSTVSGVDNKNILLYFPNGKYIFTASSTANANTSPYMAFDGDLTTFWQCDVNGNTDTTVTKSYNTYKSDPYKLGYYLDDTSPYVGGGDSTITWSTTINGIDIEGEWLQLQIPYAAYVHQYSIYTPISSSYPYLFTVVGSTDGINWNYIDQQNEAVSYFDDTNQINVMTFNVNSTDKYSYFRLIITEISKYTSFIKISNWSIIGGIRLKKMAEWEFRNTTPIMTTTPSKMVTNEAFTSLHRSMDSRVDRHRGSRVDRHRGSRVDRHIDRDHNYLGYIRGNYFDRGYTNDYLRGDIIYDNIVVARQKPDNTPLYLSATLGVVTLTLIMIHLSIKK